MTPPDRIAKMTPIVAQLVAIRKAKGIKQSSVATRMGVIPSAVCNFERGHRAPLLSTTLRYAAAIGMQLTLQPAPKPQDRNPE